MAPLKFEEHIGERLGEREIQPSKKAWDTIATKLDESKPQKKRGFPWYGIAAGFIGLLIVSILYFNGWENTSETGVQFVDAPDEAIKKEKKALDVPVIMEEEVVSVSKKTKERETKEDVSVEIPEHRSKEMSLETIANVNAKETVESEISKIPLQDQNQIINVKIAEVVAQVKLWEESHGNIVITDAEVDSLLRIAQKEILTQKLVRENRTVDAMALLSEAEGELDRSFREQIFETLKNGYAKVKTAVADRNN